MRKLKPLELARLSPAAYRLAAKLPLVLVLDDVRSQYNVGAVFRTADACAVEAIVLCGITACPPTAAIHKTALGAEDSVAWHYCRDVVAAIDALRARGYHVLAAEQCEGSTLLPTPLCGAERYAIVLGNELKGVKQAAIDRCDGCVEIPQFGTKHSLNVSVAAGIIAWEFLRQRRLEAKD